MHSLLYGASKVPAWLLDADLHRHSLHGVLAFDWLRHEPTPSVRQVKRMIPLYMVVPQFEIPFSHFLYRSQEGLASCEHSAR